ncbi:MAG TPA: hypothetical protein VHA33_28775 [Candidatus Angelobacter sp.]|jgi:hypothetical protein|nr:hypothetical protein [Candidatus Angelobacter sp.]
MEKKTRKFMILALLLAVLSAGSLSAKGKTQRLEGTVTSIGSDFVTIETKTKQTVNVKITSATKFFKDKKASTFSTMKNGDHVVFLATPDTDTTSTSYTPSAANTQKDTLSLGISFSATQASY